MGLPRYEVKQEDMEVLLAHEKRFKANVLPNDNYVRVTGSKRNDYTVRKDPFGLEGRTMYRPSLAPGQQYTGDYAQEVNEAAQEFGIDSLLLASVIKAESGFNPSAKSPVGAIGLSQLMPSTAKELGVDPYDTRDNIRGGAMYLSKMLKRFNGNYHQALAAYNAGPGAVNDWLYGTNKSGRNKGLRKSVNGIPDFKETKQYIPKVLGYYNEFKGGKK